MKGFIEVPYGASKCLVNIDNILWIEPIANGTRLVFTCGEANETDASINVTESYDVVKNKIVTASK